jgi:hypothetical protein
MKKAEGRRQKAEVIPGAAVSHFFLLPFSFFFSRHG